MNSLNQVPSIAVVIPNRNDSAYLKVCFDSVLGQSVTPDEIVFVDDQSTDNSLEIASISLNEVPGSKIVANPTCLGTMSALNEGLKHVSSDYVLFLASNDYLVAGIFERAKSSIAQVGSPGIWSALVWAADESGRHKYVYPSALIALKDKFIPQDECVRLSMALGNWFNGTTLLFHRETLLQIGGLDASYRGLADLLAALTIASLKGAVFCPEPFGVIRMHEGGYLWQTLTDLEGLEAILERIDIQGPKLSQRLFSAKFRERTKHRFRFAAIRSFHDNRWKVGHKSWHGLKYKFLLTLCRPINNHNKLKTVLAFVILRPFDLVTTVRYRLMGALWVIVTGKANQMRKTFQTENIYNNVKRLS